MNLFRTKKLNSAPVSTLKRCLTAVDLTFFGIGAIIGAGVFVLTGIAAATQSGPAVSISYILAGFAALFAALSYAEMAASIGGCGSAYNYAFAAFGELIAWTIGWALILEYTIAVSAVAIGWSGYVNSTLQIFHLGLPKALIMGPSMGGILDLPALIIIFLITILLCIGAKASARFNTIVVIIKLIAIAVFIGVAAMNVNPANWHPFVPFGWQGVAQSAAIVFFSYIGFDALSTAAEEAIEPQRNLPIGIILSLFICTLIYLLIAVLLTGIAHYSTLNVSSPVADALLRIGYPVASGIIAVGAIAGLTTVMLAMYYGLTRILLAMSRDGLLPQFFSIVNPRTQTPIKVILLCGVVISTIAALVPLADAAALVNIGTLAAFTLVCGGVMMMRMVHPDLPRPFKLPFYPAIPLMGMVTCIYLMLHLSLTTWKIFLVWLMLGLLIYFLYSRHKSILNNNEN